MMAGNPNWWSMNGMHPQPLPHFVFGASNSTPSPPPDLHQDLPVRSWSQLLLGGLGMGGGEEERFGGGVFQQQKKLESWEDQVLNLNPRIDDVKQESSSSSTHQIYDEFHPNSNWPVPPLNNHIPAPSSCITTFNFSPALHRNQDHSSECNSTGTGGVSKKARVQQSSAQPALKVRKERLGDRITALHQLVSPFGKTDTASVLSEAIGYIRFLQGQIEALSSPYMRNAAGNQQQYSVQERNCLFPEEPSQFLNDIAMDGRGASKQDSQGQADLRSRGLCLVPISCTQHVGNDNGADYWAPAAFGGGF